MNNQHDNQYQDSYSVNRTFPDPYNSSTSGYYDSSSYCSYSSLSHSSSESFYPNQDFNNYSKINQCLNTFSNSYPTDLSANYWNNSYYPNNQSNFYQAQNYSQNNFSTDSNYVNYGNYGNYSESFIYPQITESSPLSHQQFAQSSSNYDVQCSPIISQSFIDIESTKSNRIKVSKAEKSSSLKLNQEIDLKESINVKLSNKSLWQKFNKNTTEMILTKQGRRMFPTLEYNISGLEPNKKYNVFVDIVPMDNNAWKFQAGKWTPCGESSPSSSQHSVYLHPDSPNTGSFWMKNEIIFSKLKLTNNKKNPDGHILLNSMQKYIPRIHIALLGDVKNLTDFKLIKTINFPETQFIAVTAYQNTDVRIFSF